MPTKICETLHDHQWNQSQTLSWSINFLDCGRSGLGLLNCCLKSSNNLTVRSKLAIMKNEMGGVRDGGDCNTNKRRWAQWKWVGDQQGMTCYNQCAFAPNKGLVVPCSLVLHCCLNKVNCFIHIKSLLFKLETSLSITIHNYCNNLIFAPHATWHIKHGHVFHEGKVFAWGVGHCEHLLQ